LRPSESRTRDDLEKCGAFRPRFVAEYFKYQHDPAKWPDIIVALRKNRPELFRHPHPPLPPSPAEDIPQTQNDWKRWLRDYVPKETVEGDVEGALSVRFAAQ
jgi:hypothetical protein